MADSAVVVYARTLSVTDAGVVIEPLTSLTGELPVDADGTFLVRGYVPSVVSIGWWLLDADLRPLAGTRLHGAGRFPLGRDDISVAGALDREFETEVALEVARLLDEADAIAVLEPLEAPVDGSMAVRVVMVVEGSGVSAGETITLKMQPGFQANKLELVKSEWAITLEPSGWSVAESWLYMPWACGSVADAIINEYFYSVGGPSNDVTEANCGHFAATIPGYARRG